jgi:hypothetical protein
MIGLPRNAASRKPTAIDLGDYGLLAAGRLTIGRRAPRGAYPIWGIAIRRTLTTFRSGAAVAAGAAREVSVYGTRFAW